MFQLTVNHETDYNAKDSMLLINFETSPISVYYSNSKENFLEFLINICAIIGGIFTVAGIVDSMIHKTVSSVYKNSIDKLR